MSSKNLDRIREYMLDEIRPLLPNTWDLKPGVTTPTEISKTTVYLDYTRIEPLPAAPLGHALCFLELTVVTPLKDEKKGENAVDSHVVDLILALDKHPDISWNGADKTVEAETSFGWKVTVSMSASTTKTP